MLVLALKKQEIIMQHEANKDTVRQKYQSTYRYFIYAGRGKNVQTVRLIGMMY